MPRFPYYILDNNSYVRGEGCRAQEVSRRRNTTFLARTLPLLSSVLLRKETSECWSLGHQQEVAPGHCVCLHSAAAVWVPPQHTAVSMICYRIMIRCHTENADSLTSGGSRATSHESGAGMISSGDLLGGILIEVLRSTFEVLRSTS